MRATTHSTHGRTAQSSTNGPFQQLVLPFRGIPAVIHAAKRRSPRRRVSRSPVNESCSIVQLVLEFHPKPSIRSRILAVLTTEPATGADVAARAGLQYKQTVDALAILYNMERVERVGAKCTARWCLPREPERPRFRDPFMEIPTLRARAARAQQQCRPYRVFH